MNRKLEFISFILLFSIILSACSPPVVEIKVPTFNEIESTLLGSLDIELIHSTIDELAKEPRVAGMKSEKDAANFLTEQLESYGYDVESQAFEFDQYIFPNSVELIVEGFDTTFLPAPFEFSVSGKITGELIDAGKGWKSDYENIDAKGKIALVTISDIYFKDIVLHAAEAGAVAVIIYFAPELPIEGWTLGNNTKDFIPTIALSSTEGKALLDFVKMNNSVTGTVTIEGAKVESMESQNIVVAKSFNK